MVSVSADDVRDVINITSEEVPDDKVLKMIKRAEVTLELETNKTVDYSNCNEAEKNHWHPPSIPKKGRIYPFQHRVGDHGG